MGMSCCLKWKLNSAPVQIGFHLAHRRSNCHHPFPLQRFLWTLILTPLTNTILSNYYSSMYTVHFLNKHYHSFCIYSKFPQYARNILQIMSQPDFFVIDNFQLVTSFNRQHLKGLKDTFCYGGSTILKYQKEHV